MHRLNSMHKTLGLKLCVYIIYHTFTNSQSSYIRGPRQTLQYFHSIERSLHFKDFQPSLEEVIIPHDNDMCKQDCTLFSCAMVYIVDCILGLLVASCNIHLLKKFIIINVVSTPYFCYWQHTFTRFPNVRWGYCKEGTRRGGKYIISCWLLVLLII